MAESCLTLADGPAGLATGEGFAALDELAGGGARGFQLVHTAAEMMAPLARHLERRLRARGRRVICVAATGIEEPWREVGRRLGIASDDPHVVAQQIVAEARDAAVVVCAGTTARWGAAVSDRIASIAANTGFDAWVVELALARQCAGVVPWRIEAMSARDVGAFWHALGSDDDAADAPRLQDLERMWRGEPQLGAAARDATRRLALLGRSATREELAELTVAPSTVAELAHAGVVVTDDAGRCWLTLPSPPAPSTDDARCVGGLLARSPDAWDGLRGAELLLSVGDIDDAAPTAEAALRRAAALAREDLWARLERALQPADPECAHRALLRLSSVALELGDAEPALRLARQAAGHDATGFASLMAVGRAAAARGELTHAASVLEDAVSVAGSPSDRCLAEVELAEVLCSAGDAPRAHALARHALSGAVDVSVRLLARGVLGKLLLAEGAWDDAAQHFAQDAEEAKAAGNVEAELRARLNRGTALMAAGRSTEAEVLLEQVRRRGEEAGSLRAEAFALSNLAVLASQRHAYAQALNQREQAVVAFRRIGNRKWLGRSMIYLADLRLDLGFVPEAEQVLAFARQVLGEDVPPTQAAWLGCVASRIHLERGELDRARAAVDGALEAVVHSTDGTMHCDCLCLAARVALASGDDARARRAIDAANRLVGGAYKEAEVALLEAMLARSLVQPFLKWAGRALTAARASQDRRRMAEARVLLHDAAKQAGDADRATTELERARSIWRSIASSLPHHLQTRYRERAERAGHDAAVEAVVETPRPSSRRVATRHTGMVGSHPAMVQMFSVLDKVAKTDATVIVAGESGTGKELVADAIHRQSARRDGPLVKVNCAALVETLLMSELFGHERGAFTGATSQRRGCFEHADGGTVFLDEIGDVSPGTQAALLRVLQDHTFHRVGGTEPVRVDVRVLCATHRDLPAMVAAGTFREDLYYRLAGMVIEVPPLRERLTDLPLLAAEILLRMSRHDDVPLKRVAPDAIALLGEHHWPGNVRELENALRAAALFAEGEVVSADDLLRHAAPLRDRRDGVRSSAHRHAPHGAVNGSRLASAPEGPEDVVYAAVRGGTGLRELQKRLEQACIVRALSETNGHVTRAAALLGIKRPRLSQLIKQYDLRPDEGGER